MLYVRGQGVKETRSPGVALLLVSVPEILHPKNHAKRNLAATAG